MRPFAAPTPTPAPTAAVHDSFIELFGGPSVFWPAVLTAAVTLFVALLGSNVVGGLFQAWFTRRDRLRDRQQNSGRRLLVALSRLQTTTLRLGAAPARTTARDERRLAQQSSELETRAAMTGDATIVAEVRRYVERCDSFAAGDPVTNAVDQRSAFRTVIDLLVVFLR